MMRKALYISVLLGLMVMIASCTKYSFQPMHKKVIGTWQFDKVKHRAGLFQGSLDVTKNYASWEFTFLADGAAEAYSINTKELKVGKWQMEEYKDAYYDENGNYASESEFILRFYFRDNRGSEEEYVWSVGSITAKKLRASEEMSNDRYNYVLSRK